MRVFLKRNGGMISLFVLLFAFAIYWMYPRPKVEYVEIVRFWVGDKLLQMPRSYLDDIGSRNAWDSIQVVGQDGITYYKGQLGGFEIAIKDTIVIKTERK